MWGPKRWNASAECRDTRVFSHVGSAPTGLQLAFRLAFFRLPSDGISRMTARCRSRAAEERLAGTNWYSECGVLSVGMPRRSAATRASFHTLAAPRPACSLPFGLPFADYRRMGSRDLADGISRDGWDLARWDLRAKGLGIAHPAVPSVFGVRGLVVRILPPTPSPRQISQLLFPHAVGCRRENHQLGRRLSWGVCGREGRGALIMLAVTPAGMVSALGLDLETSSAAARADMVRIRSLDDLWVFDEAAEESVPLAGHQVPFISAGMFGFARLLQLALAALDDLKAGTSADVPARVGLILLLRSDWDRTG